MAPIAKSDEEKREKREITKNQKSVSTTMM